jgi:UMF1 family MFS transporter
MRKEAWAWCGYDFANTIFSGIVVTYAFSLHLNAVSGQDSWAGLANSLSMLLAALAAPLAGALADRSGNGRKFLLWSTLLCCLFTGLLGVAGGVVQLVVLFIAANLFYQVALVFYNSLLTDVSSERERGGVSGWGVSLGYVGFIVSLLLVKPIVARYGLAASFYLAAGLFLLFAVPAFRYLPAVGGGIRVGWVMIRQSFRGVAKTLREIVPQRRPRYFLLAKFFYNEALNTVIVFLSVFAVKQVGFGEQEVIRVLILLTLAAVLGSVIIGKLSDIVGAERVLLAVVALWVVVVAGLIFLPGKAAFYGLGSLAGALLGGVWTSDRIVLISLAPPKKLNEYFGFYGLVGKSSAIFGPLSFGLVADLAGYAWAMASVLVMLLIGLCFLVAFRRASALG